MRFYFEVWLHFYTRGTPMEICVIEKQYIYIDVWVSILRAAGSALILCLCTQHSQNLSDWARRWEVRLDKAPTFKVLPSILLYYFTHVLAMCFIFISPTSCTSPSCSVRYSRVDGLQRHRVDDALCRPSFLEFKFSRLLLIPFLLFPHVCFYRRALCTQPGLHSLRMPKIQPRCFVSWRWSFIAMCRKPFSSGRSTTTRDSLVAVKLRARPRVTSRKLESG